ncbi:protein GET4-like isoform X2 [Rosa rugosa]|uniref:protein GET4-like isoform X2 n=1 Tax=Rosa rugosa TaxID=74645 RepID=UPI002B40CC3C|nr:protein GET4-like isoform X2 [Rosa rugosa]
MSKERAKRGTLPPAQEQIEKVVEEGNYYGAQQLYKSISARYVAAQRYTEALDILQSGACIQLKHGQVTCGARLAALFVDTLVKARSPYDDETLGQLESVQSIL